MNEHARRSVKSKITSKGQTTVPKEVRDALKAGGGAHLEWVVEGNKVSVSAKTLNIADFAGFLGPASNGRLATIEEINEGIGQAVAESMRRSLK